VISAFFAVVAKWISFGGVMNNYGIDQRSAELNFLKGITSVTPQRTVNLLSSSVQNLAEEKRLLQGIMNNHKFCRYSTREVEVLAQVIRDLVIEEDRYKSFGGFLWIFLPDQKCGSLVNWTSSFCNQRIDRKSLLSHWCSTYVDAHDGAGVFGCIPGENENKLLSVGVTLNRDVEEIVDTVDPKDINRTGLTSGVYAAHKYDAIALKVSEARTIMVFQKDANGKVNHTKVEVDDVKEKLTSILGRC
jgi:hypothetical protein